MNICVYIVLLVILFQGMAVLATTVCTFDKSEIAPYQSVTICDVNAVITSNITLSYKVYQPTSGNIYWSLNGVVNGSPASLFGTNEFGPATVNIVPFSGIKLTISQLQLQHQSNTPISISGAVSFSTSSSSSSSTIHGTLVLYIVLLFMIVLQI